MKIEFFSFFGELGFENGLGVEKVGKGWWG